MPISEVVTISISVSGAGPTRAGFGESLIAAYNLPFTDVTREYSSLAGMVADGFSVKHPAYLAASAVKAQNPAPPLFKVGKRGLAYTQVLKMTLLSTSALDTYTFTINLAGDTKHVITVASTGVPGTDVATVNTAVTALGLTGLTATHATSILTLTMTAGNLLDVQPGKTSLITFADATTDPGIATDLAAILAADASWYGLILDSNSPAEIAAAEAWTESNGKLFGWNCSDTAIASSGSTTDIAYTSKQAAYARSFGLFSQTQLLSYSAAAWMGRLFPTDAGSENWAYKTLAGVLADNLSDTQISAVENKNCSVYTPLLGLNLTRFGKQPGGEWIDITRGVDALTNDLQVNIVALQANTKKIPFTDPGIDMFRSTINGSLARFQGIGFIAAQPPYNITLPAAASVSPVDRANRNLPGASFTAQLAGAINSLVLQGVLTQ